MRRWILLLAILSLSLSATLAKEAKKSDSATVDIGFASFIKPSEIKGTVYLRNVVDERKFKDQLDQSTFIGVTYGDYFEVFPWYCVEKVETIIRNLFTDALESSGFKVVDTQSNNLSTVDVYIKNMNLLSFGVGLPMINANFEIKIQSADESKGVISKNIYVFDMVMYAFANRIANGFDNVLNSVMFKSYKYFTTPAVVNSLKGKSDKREYNQYSYDGKRDGDKLTEIPAKIELSKTLNALLLPSNKIGAITNLDNFPSLEELNLSSNSIENIENLENLAKTLKILDLSKNDISVIEDLDKLVNLEELNLSSNEIGKSDKIENLDKLTNLKSLDLSKNDFKKIENLDKLVNLEELILSKNKITTIENIAALNKLNILRLDYNEKIKKIKDIPSENLQWLDISHSSISKIEGLENMKKLEWLSLNNTKITKIEGLDNLTNLTYLALSDTKIKKIEGLNSLVNLKKLNISRTNINKLENLDNLVNLETINMLDSLVFTLENLEKCPKLKTILFNPGDIRAIKKSTYEFLKAKDIKIYSRDIDAFVKKWGVLVIN